MNFRTKYFLCVFLALAVLVPQTFAAQPAPSSSNGAGQAQKDSAEGNSGQSSGINANKEPGKNSPGKNSAGQDSANKNSGNKNSADKDAVQQSNQAQKEAGQAAADGAAESSPEDEAAKKEEAAQNEESARQNAAWEAMWTGQREALNEMRETALKLSDSFSSQTDSLSRHLEPFERTARRLLVFVNTFKGHPNPLEAVQRRIQGTIGDFNNVLQPVLESRSEAQSMLERVNKMAQSIPEDMDKSRLSPEMRAYINDINRARLRLTVVLAQYDSLAPSFTLLKTLEKTRDEIAQDLPTLWKDYYLQGPVPWLGMDIWQGIGTRLYYSWQAATLRLPVELPITAPQWGTALLRFFIGLLFSGIFCIILRKRCPADLKKPVSDHIFRVSLPWLCLGFAFMGSALSATGDFFRLFLAFGSICLIVGQTCLAWDVRLLLHPEVPEQKSPFLRLLPLAFCSYTLFYLPLTGAVSLVIWLALLLACLIWQKKRPSLNLGNLHFEGGALDCEIIMLWICLFLGVSGLYIASMGLYLAYVSLCLALELSMGGMSLVNLVNEHLPKEGARAFLSHLVVAMAAPFVLVVAVVGVFLWVAILPGGTYLLAQYALKGINVGATQFNIIQILLIISAFYLTRAVVSMGTMFISKLPDKSMHFDSTLITPLQTILTYTAWALFGMFVLRSLGLGLSNLAMVAGGLSVGIGFGMQTIVNNFLSGLILIFGRTLQVGDVVEVGGVTGRVRKISVRATMVETYDNAVIYVPNSQFMASQLINWTSYSRSVRREIQVGVAYGSDTAKVIELLVSIAKEHENVLKYPVPSVNFADFAASSLDFRLRFWVRDFELGTSTCSDIRLRIDKVFEEQNIEIAFPQLDVHMKDAQDAAPKPAQPRPNRAIPPRPRPRKLARTKP